VTALRGRTGLLAALAVAGALLACAGTLHATYRADRRGPSVDELLYYPSGIWVRQAAVGYETASADVAWLRALQYYGEHRLTDQRYDMIGHVMGIVTDLDPRFTEAYVFGAFVLAQELRQPQRGLELLERGMRANPDDWRLAFETGFLHYVSTKNYEAAARYFTRASRLPGHPDYVERFAAFTNQRAGNAGMAILLWRRIEATGNKYMQEVARRELRRLEGNGGNPR
jgi:tetratricopeptide (TPR) repeat protein